MPDCSIRIWPTSVEPVKVTMRTIGMRGQLLADLAGFAGDDVEHARGNAGALAKFGQRQRRQRRILRRLDDHRAAGGQRRRTLRVIIAFGKFHGVIAATTPIGCLMTTMRASALGVGIVSP